MWVHYKENWMLTWAICTLSWGYSGEKVLFWSGRFWLYGSKNEITQQQQNLFPVFSEPWLISKTYKVWCGWGCSPGWQQDTVTQSFRGFFLWPCHLHTWLSGALWEGKESAENSHLLTHAWFQVRWCKSDAPSLSMVLMQLLGGWRRKSE